MYAETLPGRITTDLTQAYRVDSYLRVLHALMLRDMRTRFMGSYWGFLVQVLWPVVHMFVIAGGMTLRHMPAPILDSTMLFVATGAVPALAFRYISREMMKGVLANKPLTYYPQVRTLDVVFARTIVEVVSSFMGIIIIFGVLAALGIDPIPTDIATALGGYLCSVVFGVAIGTINVAIVQFFPGWVFGYLFIGIGMYLVSGVMFLPSYFPDQIYNILRWNPLLQIIEWVRLGYEPQLPVTIDYIYVMLWCGCSLALGLCLERTIGRRGL